MLLPDPFAPGATKVATLDGVRVFVGMPCGPDLPFQTVSSLIKTEHALSQHGVVHDITLVSGCSIVEVARNKVLDEFLKVQAATHLFWIDSDIEWEAQDFLRILALGTKMPIVAGIYPAKREPYTFFIGRNADAQMKANEWGCLPVPGVGLGFCCVQRRVLEGMAREAPKVTCSQSPDPVAWVFECDISGGEFRGEDIRFFEQAASEGYQCWLDPTVTLGHIGNKAYKASIGNCLKKVGD